MIAPFLLSLIISVALSAISMLLMPKPKAPKPEAVKDLEDPTAEAGRPLPVIFGRKTVSSVNVLWFGDKVSNTFQVKA